MKFDRDSIWTTADGKTVAIHALDDIHLANIIKFLSYYKCCNQILLVMEAEAKLRGLKVEFLDCAYLPYKNENGDWMLWNNLQHKDVKVG